MGPKSRTRAVGNEQLSALNLGLGRVELGVVEVDPMCHALWVGVSPRCRRQGAARAFRAPTCATRIERDGLDGRAFPGTGSTLLLPSGGFEEVGERRVARLARWNACAGFINLSHRVLEQ